MDQAQRTSVPSIVSLKGLPGRLVVSRALFFCLTALFASTSVFCLVAATSWVNKPFAGFLISERMKVDFLGPSHWSGVQAGLSWPDKVLTANGHVVKSMKDLDAVIQSVKIGDPVQYSIQRGDHVIEVTVPTMSFMWFDLLMRFGILFVIGILYVGLGVVVFLLKPDTTVSWIFFAGGFLLGAEYVTSFDIQSTHYGFVRVMMFADSFFAATVLHLSLVFPEKLNLVKKHPYVVVVPYVVSAGLTIALEWSYRRHPIWDALFIALNDYEALAAIGLLASILWAFWKSSSVLSRARAKVILFGAALAFPIPAISPVLSSYGTSFGGMATVVTAIPLIIFPASIAYAIVKHNLFDVDQYIKRTVGYVIMTVIVAGGYFALQTVVKTAVLDPLMGASAEKVYPILFALLTVFAFNPVSLRVQATVDKLFFRKPYDFKAAIASVSDAITSVGDLNDIIRQVIHTVRKEMFVDTAGVILLDDRKKECQALFIADGVAMDQEQKKDLCVAYDDPLLALLSKEKKLITTYDIAENPRYAAVRESCGKQFATIGASLALPLFYRDEFTGVLALGYKKSGHFYTREDIELLKTVSGMTSTAIEQAREQGQKAVLMQLFSKHVSPEVAEAVWEQREQFLEGGRPRSQKLIVTALFTDLAGFSTVSEKMDPQALMDWLNAYMEKMTKIVMDHGGVVDDYYGDAIKVNFGVPLPRTTDAEIRQDAVNAVTCALAMEQEMIRLNMGMRERGLPMLKMRVGIYTGPVVAGSLGSADRLKYTTIGNTVNTASRLESFDKELMLPHLETSPCRILIGETTLRYLDEQFATQKVGELSLKGKEEKITAYCVVGTGRV